MKIDLSNDATSTASLADLMNRLPLMGLSEGRLKNQLSGLRTFCRVIGKEPHHIAATPESIRVLIASANPHAAMISASRWTNVICEVRSTMRLFGIVPPTAPAATLPHLWQTLVDTIPLAPERSTFRQFAIYCAERSISPSDVTDEAIAAYEGHLSGASLSRAPNRTAKDVRRYWNRIAANGGEIRPLEIPSNPHQYSLAWDEFDRGYRHDVEACIRPRQKSEWNAPIDRAPLRDTSSDQYRRMLRRLASAVVRTGVPPKEIKGLADVIRPNRLQAALEWMMARHGGEPSKDMFHMATLAHGIARDWLELPRNELKQIAGFMKGLRYDANGMTEKNRARLRQFVDEGTHRKMYFLPFNVFQRVRNEPVITVRLVREMGQALMLGIVLVAPIRLKNLASLDHKRHFISAYSISDPTLALTLTASELKNKIDLSLPIPPELADMLDFYMAKCQPLLARKQRSNWLFPGRAPGSPITPSGMSYALPAFIKRNLGLKMNVHLFGHLAAMIYLNSNPGDYETVRRLLAHKNLATTIKHYVGLEATAAFDRYHNVLRS